MEKDHKNKFEDENELDDDEDEYEFTEDYVKPPFFDWKAAQREYGLEFLLISKNGYEEFIEEKFLNDFITLRKCYIQRDFSGIRFWIHKFKGSFK